MRFNNIIVLILDWNSEKMCARRMGDIGKLVCLRHLFRSKAVTNLTFFSAKKPIVLHTCTKYSELPSNMSTMNNTVPT